MRSTAIIVMPSIGCLGALEVGIIAIEKPSLAASRKRSWPRGFVVFGEVGLAGEIRPAPRGQERLREAAKLGFSMAMIPTANAPKQAIEGMTIIPVDRIDDAFNKLREIQ